MAKRPVNINGSGEMIGVVVVHTERMNAIWSACRAWCGSISEMDAEAFVRMAWKGTASTVGASGLGS